MAFVCVFCLMVKRGRSRSRSRSRSKYPKYVAFVGGRRGKRKAMAAAIKFANRGVKRLTSMIETKEAGFKSNVNVGLAHNNLHVVAASTGGDLNPFSCGQGVQDEMGQNAGTRIGDKFTVRGLMIKGFLENAIGRGKVYYRVMLIKKSKGDTLTRATLFKGDTDNKMIDQVNTERFTIVAQKVFNISCSNTGPSGVGVTGVPTGGIGAGIGTKVFKFWIPGRKFGRYGNVQYENGSTNQLKFFDYRICIVTYDWYGTPQDVNDVGKINELYCKLYFKDA